MIREWKMAGCLIVCGVGLLPLYGQEKSELQVVGLTIAAVDKESEYEQSLVQGTQSGTQVYVRVKLPGRFILELDDKQQAVQMEDSTGQNLKSRESSFGVFADISEDHQSVTIPFSAESLPAKDSDSITLKGEATVICGSELTEQTTPVELKADATVQLGKTPAKITSIGSGFEENSTSIDFESNQPFKAIQELAFVDASGTAHAAESRGSGSFGFGDEMTYSQSYEIPVAADSIKAVKVKYFTKVDGVKVPIDLKVNLGLSATK